MGSKLIVFLVLFLATVLLISSEVAARDLAETSNTVDTSEEINEAIDTDAAYGDQGGYGGGRGGYGGGRGGYGGGRGGYGGGGRGRCRHGCCGRGYYGCRCCSYPGQKPDAEPQN